jgi:GT2 family glycosyltransferase
MERERVSVVVLAHNNWPDLDDALRSVFAQTRTPDEIIVVDNGSTDGTPAHVAGSYGERVCYVRQDNCLDGGGYNGGIRVATGDFIQLLDGDDVLASNKIERALEVFHADPSADIVFSDARFFDGTPDRARAVERPLGDFPDFLRALCARGGDVGLNIASLYRRSVFDRVGLFDENVFGADHDFWFRAAHAGVRFRFAPGTVLYYRQWPRQMTRQRMRLLGRAEYTLTKALGYVRDEELRMLLRRRLARALFWQAMTPAYGLTRAEAVAKLRLARQMAPSAVRLPVYVAARIALGVPGGRRVFAHEALRAPARLVARVLGLRGGAAFD